MSSAYTTQQTATDYGYGDYQDRITLPDGTLAYVAVDPCGAAYAYRRRTVVDCGGNLLAERRANESCVGFARFRTPHTISVSDRVPGVRLAYVGPAADCTGRSVYLVTEVK